LQHASTDPAAQHAEPIRFTQVTNSTGNWLRP